ncbi:MAG: O-antigen ligase family protein [Pseudomonadota bacterium]
MFRNPGFRLGLVCLVAASVGLSLAIVSISKVLLVITVLVVLLRGGRTAADVAPLQKMWTPRVATFVVFAFAFSLLWTTAPLDSALGAVGKYGKLLVIPALLVLIRTRQQAVYALGFFMGAQVFLLFSAWLLYFGVPVPWATANMAKTTYAVFSSYLDQSIMSAVVFAVFWHLKARAPTRPLSFAAIAVSILALASVLIVFEGRTGYLVLVAMVCMSIFWALPARWRFASVFVPPLMVLVAFVSFDKVAQRFSATQAEILAYSSQPDPLSSSSVRLNFWKTSVRAIAEKPLMGAGAGSWVTEFNRIGRHENAAHQSLGSNYYYAHGNPHQEFLLWGVQLGLGGIFLMWAFIASILLDLRKMDRPVARAGQSMLLALIVSCLFNSSLYDAYIGDFFCVSLGVLLAYGFHSREVSRGSVATAVVPHLKNEDRLIKT